MMTKTRPECDTCHKVMSIAQAVVMVVAGVPTSSAWTVPCPSWRTTTASAYPWICSGVCGTG